MKIYNQADFDALERNDDGYIVCECGDWSDVDFKGTDYVEFGDGCELGDRCRLGDGCELGGGCMLGNWCKLGDGCELGNECKLGDRCELGEGCALENGRVEHATYFFASNIGSANRTVYAYCNMMTGDIYIRAGCWFSDIDAFEQRVRDVHGGTQHEVDYIAFADFARARFARYKTGECVVE